eukprot:1162073-Pelagomonas_calceolata.AAC.4
MLSAPSKNEYGSFLVAMNTCCRLYSILGEELLEQGIEVPGNIYKYVPDWAFPNVTGTSAQHQSHPDAICVRPIQGRATHLDLKMIPYLLKIEISTFLQRAAAQHAGSISVTLMKRLLRVRHNAISGRRPLGKTVCPSVVARDLISSSAQHEGDLDWLR